MYVLNYKQPAINVDDETDENPENDEFSFIQLEELEEEEGSDEFSEVKKKLRSSKGYCL